MLDPEAKNSEQHSHWKEGQVEHGNEVVEKEVSVLLAHCGLHSSEDTVRLFLGIARLIALLLDVLLVEPEKKEPEVEETEKGVNESENEEDVEEVIDEAAFLEIVGGVEVIEERNKSGIDEGGQ